MLHVWFKVKEKKTHIVNISPCASPVKQLLVFHLILQHIYLNHLAHCALLNCAAEIDLQTFTMQENGTSVVGGVVSTVANITMWLEV